MKTTTRPWRVVAEPEGGSWAVWTREDNTPGSRNNYEIAGGIQDEQEARLLSAAPELLAALEQAIAAHDEIMSSGLPALVKARGQ